MLWWWLLLLGACEGGSILAVFPVPSRSHALLGDAVVSTLLHAGHDVTYISAFVTETHPNLTHVNISPLTGDTEAESLRLTDLVRSPRPPQQTLQAGADFARRALQHPSVRRLLADEDTTFDLVLAEWFFSGLLAPLASLYECPLVWYSSVDASWVTLQLTHAQSSPAHAADPQARRLPARTLRDRLERLRDQTLMTAWMYYMLYYVENADYDAIYRELFQLRARLPPSYEDLVYNASLLLLNSQPFLGQAVATPPSAQYVGGHHIQVPTKPLPQDLKKLLDESSKGVIYFSLGSNVKSKDLPDYMKMQLLDVFGGLQQTVIWKFEEDLADLPDNVHIVKWAPQTSILNHTNTKLFISHGGFLSYMEAMYFGVPIIGVPFFGDQFLVMELARARGHGRRVRFSEYLPYSLRDAIIRVLGNSSYQINVKRTSDILQHPLVPPRQELLYWVELILQHGGDHLWSPAVHLSMVERLYLDAIAAVLMLMWFLTKVWKVLKVHWNSDTGRDKKNQ